MKTNILERLLTGAKEVFQVRESLLKALGEAEIKLCEVLDEADVTINDPEQLEKFDFNGFGFRSAGSKHGRWKHIVSLETGNLLLSNRSRGSEFFYHDDFNCRFSIMTNEETLSFANQLKEFTENMEKMLSELKVNMQEIESRIL